jgi:glycosidase
MGGGFTATMNYFAFAFPAKGFLIDGRMSAHDFGQELDQRRREYPPAMQFAMQNLVDSHDTDRVGSMIVNRPVDHLYLQPDRFDYDVSPRTSPRHDRAYNVRKPNDRDRQIQRMIVLLQMTYLGAPMVYYGDEAGMWGGDDPCDRWPMVWDDLTYDAQAADPLNRERPADAVAFDVELFEFYRRAIALRSKSDVLRHGSYSNVASDDEAQFVAFQRTLDDSHALVAFNRGEKDYTWTLPAGAADDLQVTLVSTGGNEAVTLKGDGNDRSLIIPSLTAALLTTP